MKRLYATLLALTFALTSALAQQADMLVGRLINSGDWFELERVYPNVKDDVQTPMLKQMAEVFLAYNFNRWDELNEKLPQLIAEHQDRLGYESVCNLINLGAAAEYFNGNYEAAADMVKSMADIIVAATGSLEETGVEELLVCYDSVRELPAPTIDKPDTDVTIAFSDSSGLHIKLPVSINGKTYDFIFDTGASSSLIASEIATEIGAQSVGEPIFVGGATGGGYLERALIERMDIGPITLRNVLVFVNENSAEDDPLKVDAVLGMDFIKRLGEVQIDMVNHTLRIPAEKSARPEYGKNILLEQNIPVMEVIDEGGDRMTFILDTGNSGADFFDLWFAKNRELVSTLPTETQNTWGHGGIVEQQIVRVPQYTMRIGDRAVTLHATPATIPSGDIVTSPHHGSLGMGLLKSVERVTLNFDDMFVKIE